MVVAVRLPVDDVLVAHPGVALLEQELGQAGRGPVSTRWPLPKPILKELTSASPGTWGYSMGPFQSQAP